MGPLIPLFFQEYLPLVARNAGEDRLAHHQTGGAHGVQKPTVIVEYGVARIVCIDEQTLLPFLQPWKPRLVEKEPRSPRDTIRREYSGDFTKIILCLRLIQMSEYGMRVY